MNIRTTIALFFLLATASMTLHAQSTDTIVPNPKAVLLKRIWMIRGSSGGGEQIGMGAGSVEDVNHDSLSDVAVYRARDARWNLYLGDRKTGATASSWVFDSSASVPAYPTVGYFFGDSQQIVGFPRYERTDTLGRAQFFLKYSLFKVEGGSLQSEPFMVFDPSATILSGGELSVSDIVARDLDNDGDDELILVFGAFLREGVRSSIGEIWIYEGGPNFQVDSPTVVLRDIESNGDDLRATIADFNGDRYPDILLTGSYDNLQWVNKYRFFWGKPSLQQLSEYPDHSLTLNDAAVGVTSLPAIGDFDRDQIADIAGSKLPFTPLFLSSSGKPITERTFRMDDADQILYTPEFFAEGAVGPLNDSLEQRPMLPLFGPSPLGGAMLKVLSTNQQPIEASYDAYYGGAYDGIGPYNVFGKDIPTGDVNGDGWSDYMTAQPK
ncbi:MAG: VCBS repeat-containing protein, partial [Armatimonadetes bacterium]|nr:VCBS repeat-containing protein [Armatimonadota bacterium]